jgi:hypothetical protein
MAKQFTKEELANLPKTPYAAFGDFLASSTSNLFSPTRVNPIRGAGTQGQVGALGKTSAAPLPQASTTYNPFAKALQNPQDNIKSPMPFATFGEQQEALTTPFNPFLTTGTFGGIGDVGIKSDASPMPSSESTQMSTPSAGSVTSTRPLDATNAQNTAQRSEQTANSLMDAWNGIQSMYREGVPVVGTSDLKVKRDVYGRPYTVVSMSPTDEQGRSQKAETMSFGISPEMKASQGGSMAPMQQGQQAVMPSAATLQSAFETLRKNNVAPQQQGQAQQANDGKQYVSTGYSSSFNPFASQNSQQSAEYERRKQLAMSGQGSAGSMASEAGATGTIVPPRPEGAQEMPARSLTDPYAGATMSPRDAKRWDAAEKAGIQSIRKKYGV